MLLLALDYFFLTKNSDIQAYFLHLVQFQDDKFLYNIFVYYIIMTRH